MSEPVTNQKSRDRSSLEHTMEAAARRLVGAGIATAARFKTSLRVGGAGRLASLDGVDGLVVADGSTSGFVFGDRVSGGNYGLWYRSGTSLRLNSADGGDLWQINSSTSLIAQDALTALASRGTNISASDAAGWAPSGSRLVRPTGKVYLQLALAATGAVGAGAVIATVTAGHAPTSGTQTIILRYNSTPVTGVVNASGQVAIDTALVNTDIVIGTVEYYR